MGNLKPYKKFEVLNNSTTYTIDLSDDIDLYKIYTSSTITMSNNFSIGVTGTPEEGTEIQIDYSGRINTLGTAYTVTVLGTQVGQGALLRDCRIICNYNGSSWIVKILGSEPANTNRNTASHAIGTGGTLTLISGRDENIHYITGSTTLTSNYSVTTSGTPLEGDWFDVYYEATPSGTSSYTVTILGVLLTKNEAFGGDVLVRAIYDGSGWKTHKYTGGGDVYNKRFSVIVPVSFETGEQGNNEISPSLYEKLKLVYWTAFATKDIAGTDNGNISLYINGIDTTLDITATMSASNGDQLPGGGAISQTVNAGETMWLKTSKTTEGGKALVSLIFERQ